MKSPHTISAYECSYEEQEMIKERLLSISRLNNEGKTLQREQYDTEGNLIKKDEYQYQGELVVLSSEEDLIEKRINKTIYEYRDNKLVNQKEYYNEELSIEMVYTYNNKGQLMQNQILNNDGSANSKYTYEYLDQKTSESFFDEEMTLVRLTETVKDVNGKIIEEKITEIYEDRQEANSQTIEYKVSEGESIKNYYKNGIETYEIIECFNEDARIYETITYDVAKDEESVTTLEYDESGHITKEEITKNEEVISVTNVELDEYENRVKLILYTKLAVDFYDTTTYKFVNEYSVDE
jgi:hypothetical protein